MEYIFRYRNKKKIENSHRNRWKLMIFQFFIYYAHCCNYLLEEEDVSSLRSAARRWQLTTSILCSETILSNLVKSRFSSLMSCTKQTSFQNDDKNVLGQRCYRTVPNGCQNQLQHLGFIYDLAFLTYRL